MNPDFQEGNFKLDLNSLGVNGSKHRFGFLSICDDPPYDIITPDTCQWVNIRAQSEQNQLSFGLTLDGHPWKLDLESDLNLFCLHS